MLVPIYILLACTGFKDSAASQDEASWSIMSNDAGPGVLLSAWSDGDEVVMVGGGMDENDAGILVRYSPENNSLCWEELVADQTMWWIHGDGNGQWYAVGNNGTIVHAENGSMTREDVDTEATLYGVWMDGNNVFAVGGDVTENTGEIWQRSNGTWRLFAADLPGVVFKVWNNWFVGHEVAWKLTGEDSNSLNSYPPNERLVTIRGESEDDFWAVGGSFSATVLHWENDVWNTVDPSGLSQPLNGIWTAPDETVWVAGMSGTQGYLNDDGGWSIPEFPLTNDHFHAVWKHEDEVLFIGGNLLSSAAPYHGTIGRFGSNTNTLIADVCTP